MFNSLNQAGNQYTIQYMKYTQFEFYKLTTSTFPSFILDIVQASKY